MKQAYNPPAFPASRAHFTSDGEKLSSVDWQTGMTLHDHVAVECLKSLIAHHGDSGCAGSIQSMEGAAETALQYADAFLKVRSTWRYDEPQQPS